MEASPPQDLLAEIFRRLDAVALIRSAAACKTWRRVILDNASCLRLRPDRFLPELLLGFFYSHWTDEGRQLRLQRVPGPLESALAAVTTVPPSTVAAIAGGVDIASYEDLLSSRDGILLLGGKQAGRVLCLCNPMTGGFKVLPGPAGALRANTYVLVTGYDLSPSEGGYGHDLAARIFAVSWEFVKNDVTTYQYQQFSASGAGGSSTGSWGPVKSSPEFRIREGLVPMSSRGAVICRGAVHWLSYLYASMRVTCTVSIDMRTGRAGTTELPEQCRLFYDFTDEIVLATSMDARLSVACSLWRRHQIQVWVLMDAGGGQWALRHTIELPRCCGLRRLSRFGPRSGCLLASLPGKVLRVDIERGSCSSLRCTDPPHGFRYYAYEMDWATYISKMKHF